MLLYRPICNNADYVKLQEEYQDGWMLITHNSTLKTVNS